MICHRLALLSVFLALPAHAQDGGIPHFPVNGPRSVTQCPAMDGSAICFSFPGPAKAALEALARAPLVEKWEAAAKAASANVEAAQREAAAARLALAERSAEAASATASAASSKDRADKLQKALDGSWLIGILKVALPAAGALGLGFLMGRLIK